MTSFISQALRQEIAGIDAKYGLMDILESIDCRIWADLPLYLSVVTKQSD
jgi:hypothetical protein